VNSFLFSEKSLAVPALWPPWPPSSLQQFTPNPYLCVVQHHRNWPPTWEQLTLLPLECAAPRSWSSSSAVFVVIRHHHSGSSRKWPVPGLSGPNPPALAAASWCRHGKWFARRDRILPDPEGSRWCHAKKTTLRLRCCYLRNNRVAKRASIALRFIFQMPRVQGPSSSGHCASYVVREYIGIFISGSMEW